MTDEELDQLASRSATLEAIARDLRQARTAIRVLCVFAVVIVIVIAGVTLLSMNVARNTHDINTAHDIFVGNCESGNEFRAGERELWGFIFNAQASTTRNPAQQAQFNELKALVERTFAARDCNAVVTPLKEGG